MAKLNRHQAVEAPVGIFDRERERIVGWPSRGRSTPSFPGPSRARLASCRAIETAERHGLGLENPVAYHRAFPSVPVPETAYIVLRGEIPHVGPGRLVIHREGDAFRAAVLVRTQAEFATGRYGAS